MEITGKLCDVKLNQNKVRVTEAFIDDIVNHKFENLTLPLCADVRGLINDRTIDHEYDPVTNEFHSQIIGGLYDFQKENSGEDTSLIIGARVMKRYGAVCNALTRLFVENRLKFSFEITCGEYVEEDDGSITIDASPLNYLEGVAVVTFPACEDAIARELVAECLAKGDECDLNTDEKMTASVTTEETLVIAEENTSVNAENETQVNAEVQTAAEQVNAEVKATAEQVNVEVQTADKQVNAEVKAADKQVNAETHENAEDNSASVQTAENAECKCEDPEDNDDDDQQNASCKKENASDEASHVPDTATLIAELKNTVESMAMELASLKESIASIKTEPVSEKQIASDENKHEEPVKVNAEVEPESEWTLLSPFMASMSIDEEKTWTLL